MDFFSAASAAVAVSCLVIILKELKPELVLPVTIAFSVLILTGMISPIEKAITVAKNLASETGIDKTLLSGAVKITGTAITAELISSLLRDAGQTSAAEKTELAARITIISLTLPVITELCNTVFEML